MTVKLIVFAAGDTKKASEPRQRLPHSIPSAIKSGGAAMPIYLFRNAGDTRSFAYSQDVTGRNIPRKTEHANWLFVTIVDAEHLKPLALQRLRMEGYYVFNG